MAEAPAFDPAQVPVQPAATLLLLDDRPELEVLLLRRRVASAFVPGMYVFPGGKVDAEDGSEASARLARGLSAGEAEARLGSEGDALAFWVAAVRETLEEAGVLFATDASGGALDLSDRSTRNRLAALRTEVDAGHRSLPDAIGAEGWQLELAAMHYVARWITPQGPPRRYDTRFFVAPLPPGQTATPDESEALESLWARPADALARFESGAWPMLPPTVGMLKLLEGYRSTEEVLDASARVSAAQERQAKVESIDVEPGWRVVMPHESDYDAAVSDGMYSWIRLPAAG